MKTNYQIEGLTCGSCKAIVETTIGKINGVSSVALDFDKKIVTVEHDNNVYLETFQAALPSKYKLSLDSKAHSISNQSSKLSQLKPLLLILFYLFTTATFLNYKSWNWSEFMLDYMGLFYIVFSFFKFLDYKGFPNSFRMYDPLANQFPIYAWSYPFIETALGIMFLLRLEIKWGLGVTILILGITTFGVIKTLLSKKTIQCACLGTALKLPMTEATLIENAIMIIMALVMFSTHV
jgi:copper chaperone CopZ